MPEGFRSLNGNVASPPYTNGPYEFSEFLAVTGGLAGVLRGTAGKVYYIDEENGSDNNSGLSPQRAFQTFDKCFGNTTGNKMARDDYSDDAEYYVIVFPGSYVPSDDLRIYGHGIHIIGLGHPGTDSGVNIIDTNQTYAGVLVGAANTTIENIQFLSTQDLPAIWLLASDNTVVKNCVFKGTSGTTTTAIQGMDVRSTKILGCLIGEAGGDFTNGIYMEGGADYYCIDSYIAGNRIYADGAAAKGILIDNTSTTYGNVIERNFINLGKATGASIGIDNNSTGCNLIVDNFVVMATGDVPIESASSPTGIVGNHTMDGTGVDDPNSPAA